MGFEHFAGERSSLPFMLSLHAITQLVYRPVAHHANVGFRYAKKSAHISAGFLIVKSHDDDGAVALLQILQAAREPLLVKARSQGVGRSEQVRTKLFEKTFLSLRPATHVENGHSARS